MSNNPISTPNLRKIRNCLNPIFDGTRRYVCTQYVFRKTIKRRKTRYLRALPAQFQQAISLRNGFVSAVRGSIEIDESAAKRVKETLLSQRG